jgi:hypothetical protein
MLSGNASGGQLGLPLAGAVAGATLASLLLAGKPEVQGVLGPGVVGLFALLVAGRFFSDLTTTNALLLFFAPLLCWLTELPYVRTQRPWIRVALGVVLVAIPVTLAVAQAQRSFVEASKASSSPNSGTSDDYQNYGH